VAPELFHHGLGESEIFRADQVGDGKGEERVGKGSARGTWNVGYGARHWQLWVDEVDREMRKLVKDRMRNATQRGECPIDAVLEEQSWNGCELGECGAQS
jgi:hypothetical protein